NEAGVDFSRRWLTLKPQQTLRSIMRRLWANVSAVASFCALFATPSASGFIINPNDPDPWLTTASGSRTGNGAPATITWSIVSDGTSLTQASGSGTASSNLISFMDSTFGGIPSQTNLTLQPWFHVFTE